MRAPVVTVRPAAAGDRERLLAWRNDPETRRQSRGTAPVAPDEHARWLARRLATPEAPLLVAVEAATGAPVGQVRLDPLGDGAAEVSLTVAPEHRGRGLAAPALRAACEHGRAACGLRRFVAWIRPDNAASRRAFARAGFTDDGEGPRGDPPLVRMVLDAG